MRTAIVVVCASMILLAVPEAGAAADTRGYIYGTVISQSGNEYNGVLRWGKEEAFWDDHFNASKEDLPYLDDVPKRDRGNRRRLEVFGVTIGYRWDEDGRQLIARFGDIKEIEVLSRSRARLTMRNGEIYEIDDGSNDMGNKIKIRDESLGEVSLDWREIDRIVFRPTPPDLQGLPERLYGKVETTDRDLEGYIQWDKEECLITDRLDGETRDGDLSIEMGKIRAIERDSRHGALVILKDGREIVLEDTNDVDDSNRGIFVEDPRYGRVEVSWEGFRRVVFVDPPGSGLGYDSYGPAKFLEGRVVTREGKEHAGRVVFDLDEAETWEILNGERDDLEFHVPFSMIRAIEPSGRHASKLELEGGETLVLEDGNDVTDDNDGVLVFSGNEEIYVPWDEVRRLELD